MEAWDAGGRAGGKRDGHAAAWGDVSLLGEKGTLGRKPLGSWLVVHAVDPSNLINVRPVFENS